MSECRRFRVFDGALAILDVPPFRGIELIFALIFVSVSLCPCTDSQGTDSTCHCTSMSVLWGHFCWRRPCHSLDGHRRSWDWYGGRTYEPLLGFQTWRYDHTWVRSESLGYSLLPSAMKLQRLCFYRRVSVHMLGCLPQCMLGYTPWEQTPPGSRPPGSRHPPPKSWETATAADGTHPTRMHSYY